MYAQFDYRQPKTETELFRILECHGETAALYAGGTDLLIHLRSGKVMPQMLLDIKRLPFMQQVREEEGMLSIGASCSFHQLHNDFRVKKWAPSLAKACQLVGSVQIRLKGTIGGNIQTASPAGDGLNALWGLDATVVLLSKGGLRRVPISEFITGPRQTALVSQEVISRIEIPKRESTREGFFKVGRRNALAISVVNGMVLMETDDQGTIIDARISLGCVGPTPLRITRAEEIIKGSFPDAELLSRIEQVVQDDVQPISDGRASADYRRYVAGIYVSRKINELMEVQTL